MGSLNQDIEEVHALVVRAWIRRDWLVWLFASCVLLAWRAARWLGIA